MMRITLILCLLTVQALAQKLPETEIWLFDLVKTKDVYTPKNGRNISNHPGYDSQPSFSPDGKTILYTSICEDNQADVYKVDLKKKEITRLTDTPESEFSPSYMPGGKSFSCVVIERDSTQRVWSYELNGAVKEVLAPYADSIGYHTWLNKDTLLYYKLTDPHSLRALNLIQHNEALIAEAPARSFKPTGHLNEFIYAIKDSANMEFRIYHPRLRKSTRYAVYPSLTEDFIWHPQLGLIKSEKAKLLRYNADKQTWELLFDLSAAGIQKITRFAFDPSNKLLVLVNTTEP